MDDLGEFVSLKYLWKNNKIHGSFEGSPWRKDLFLKLGDNYLVSPNDLEFTLTSHILSPSKPIKKLKIVGGDYTFYGGKYGFFRIAERGFILNRNPELEQESDLMTISFE